MPLDSPDSCMRWVAMRAGNAPSVLDFEAAPHRPVIIRPNPVLGGDQVRCWSCDDPSRPAHIGNHPVHTRNSDLVTAGGRWQLRPPEGQPHRQTVRGADARFCRQGLLQHSRPSKHQRRAFCGPQAVPAPGFSGVWQGAQMRSGHRSVTRHACMPPAQPVAIKQLNATHHHAHNSSVRRTS